MRIENEPTFSIVVPLFNEEENVGPLVENIFRSVSTSPGFTEIILVDDGSRDATSTIAAALSEQDARVRLIRHERNRGLGGAIRRGLAASTTDRVLYTDADLPFDFSLIPDLIARSGSDRLIAGRRLNRGEGPRRWLLTKGYNFLIWLFFGLYMADVNFACKVIPRELLSDVEFDSDGSFIDVEMLLEARRYGLSIEEFPMTYYPREHGVSTLSRPAVIFDILHEMFHYAGRLFGDRAGGFAFIGKSPLAKTSIFIGVLSTAILLNTLGVGFTEMAGWLSLTLEIGVASALLGWRFGLFAAAIAVIEMESWLLWQSHVFLSPQNYQFLLWALIAVVFSQIGSGSLRLVQRSLRFNTSEWVKS